MLQYVNVSSQTWFYENQSLKVMAIIRTSLIHASKDF